MVTYKIYLYGVKEVYYETTSSINLEATMQKLEASKTKYYVVS
jgi:hypothetical protein